MDILKTINWYCLEIHNQEASTRSRLIQVAENVIDKEIGEEIEVGGQKGTLIASSAMGITVLDLFSEIITEEDMKIFLKTQGVVEDFFGPALILRTFIQMLAMAENLKKSKDSTNEVPIPVVDTVDVKIEEINDFPDDNLVQYNENLLVRDVVMDSENEDDDSFLDEGNESLETDGNFFIDVKSQKETKNPWKRTCKAIQCGCNKVFPTFAAKRRHYIELKIYECKECGECLYSYKSLRTHRARVHNNERDIKYLKVKNKLMHNPDGTFNCRVSRSCNEIFKDIPSRDEHENTVLHFKCEPCSRAFKTKKEYNEHYKNDPTCVAQTCPNCGENFQQTKHKLKKSLKYHIERCMNLRNYVCEECGMDFNHEEALKNHRKTHSKSAEQARILQKLNNQAHKEESRKHPRKFKCDQCDRAYTTNQHLKNHKISEHGNGVKLQCPECPAQLKTPQSLKRHIKAVHRIHERPIIAHCQVCNKGYHLKQLAKDCYRRCRKQIVENVAMINPDQVAMEAEQSSQFESHNQSEIRNLMMPRNPMNYFRIDLPSSLPTSNQEENTSDELFSVTEIHD